MSGALTRFLTLCAVLFASAVTALAQSQEQNGRDLAAALEIGESGNWDEALSLARGNADPVALDIIQWSRLRDGAGEFADYQDFVAKRNDWPGLHLLRIKAESVIPENHRPREVLAFFADNPPETGAGILRLSEAFRATGMRAEEEAIIINAWRTFSMPREERVKIFARYEKLLEKHHIARLDMLLWRGIDDQAEGLFTLVPEGWQTLAKARIGLRKRVKGVDSLIEAVPASLADDPGLAYERFIWRVRKGRYEDARDLMLERSTSAKALGRPDEWAERRRAYARKEMRDGNNRRAYQLASRHYLAEGSDYADLEWLAGYIALRKLNDPMAAVAHFSRFQAVVATPISYGRAGYWLGRAYEAAGDKVNAKAAYEFGAGHQTSFYGQLAAEKIGAPPDPDLAGLEATPDWRKANFLKSSVLRAALLFHYADIGFRAEQFIKQLGESQDRTGLQQLADIALEMGRPQIAVRLSKQAIGRGHVLMKSYFPITNLARIKTRVDPELAMSIARRESELDQYVISPAGARGLMQVMPGTARKVAGDIGLTYSRDKLTDDWKYNATLGSTYLAEQLADFNGSYILAFAAYNAGPNRARQWIERYGDPRLNSADQVDWIEHIPFRETRNYVMRVMESVHIYRARLSGKTPKLRISKDLKRG